MITRLCVGAMPIIVLGCAPSAPYSVTGDTIVAPLSDAIADKSRGTRLFAERGDAHCVLCHAHAGLNVPFQGDLGPNLTDVGQRLSPAQIRLRIADYDAVKPGTTMPPYFRADGLHQVLTEHQGETVLTGAEIEDIIAFLTDDSTDP